MMQYYSVFANLSQMSMACETRKGETILEYITNGHIAMQIILFEI